jgi:hypothetical protein
MKKKLSRFEQMMIAITFAEAGEFEVSRTFAEKRGEGHEQQPWMSEIADGELEPAA